MRREPACAFNCANSRSCPTTRMAALGSANTGIRSRRSSVDARFISGDDPPMKQPTIGAFMRPAACAAALAIGPAAVICCGVTIITQASGPGSASAAAFSAAPYSRSPAVPSTSQLGYVAAAGWSCVRSWASTSCGNRNGSSPAK